MSSLLWKKKLRLLFLDICHNDKSIDQLRNDLWQLENFNPKELFSIIDIQSKSFLTLTDLKSLLTSLYINFKEEALRRVVHYYDKRGNFSINFESFITMIQPKFKSNVSNNIKIKKDEMIGIFVEILLEEMNLFIMVGELTKDIKITKEFNIYEGFMTISKGEKYIDIKLITDFIREDKLSGIEVNSLIYRFDVDNDGKWSYDEFRDIFFPFQMQFIMKEQRNNNKNNNIQYLPLNKEKRIKENCVYDKEDYKNNNKVDYYYFEKEERVQPSKLNYNYNNKYEGELKAVNKEYERYKENELNKDYLYKDQYENRKETINTLTLNEFNKPQNTYSLEPKTTIIQTPIIKDISLSNKVIFYGKKKENDLIVDFLEYISTIVSLEKSKENLKESLSLQCDITLLDLFYYFDYSKTNSITISDFISICKKSNLSPLISEVELVFKRYSPNNPKEINFNDFVEMIQPLKEEYKTILINRKLSNEDANNFSLETKQIISEILKSFLITEKYLMNMRLQLSKKESFSHTDIWGILMKYSNHNGMYIDKDELRDFLDNNGEFYTKFEIEIIITRFESYHNGYINYIDFEREFLNF